MICPQMTYGSADGVEGRAVGGWGVLAETAGIGDGVRHAMMEHMSVWLPTTVTPFSSDKELRKRPVRCRRLPGDALGSSLLWRSVEAGPDHSGRAGNVFTHAVLVPHLVGMRPIDWLESPDWLTPFGPEEVRTALTRDEFRPAKLDALRNTLDWVQSEPEKIAKLPWLLDAVMALVESGTQVVLRTTSAEAAHWIRLTSWLLDAEAAALLSFSTYEDARSVRSASLRTFHLVAVPETEGPIQVPQAAVVLDLNEQVKLDQQRRLWVFASGATFQATYWSTAALDLIWLSPERLSAVLAQRDQLGMELLGSVGVSPFEVSQLVLRLSMLVTPGATLAGRDELAIELLERWPTHLPHLVAAHELAREVGYSWPKSPLAGPSVEPTTSMDDPQEIDGSHREEFVDITKPPFSPPPDEEPKTPAERDLVEKYPLPNAASALCAAVVLADAGWDLSELVFGKGWLSRLPRLRGRELLAVLHVVSQADNWEPTREELCRAFARLPAGSEFDRIGAPVLLLAARADLTPDSQPWHLETQELAWFADLAEFVSRAGEDEALPLAVHLDAMARVRGDLSAAMRRCLSESPSSSVWSLRTAGGESLAGVVSRLLAQLTPGHNLIAEPTPWGHPTSRTTTLERPHHGDHTH